MNTQKHTPAPWDLKQRATNHYTLTGATAGLIADIHKDEDARLICAAPELLETLMSIADHEREFDGLEDWETMVVRMTEKARAAIAKATGEAA